MYPERLRKVSGSKGCRDVPHVLSDRDDPSGVRTAACVKDDPSTVHKVLKNVRRRILIHAHDRLATRLHGRESTV